MKIIEQEEEIQEITLKALVRSFFQESFKHGFNPSDYLQFINLLFDFALNNQEKQT